MIRAILFDLDGVLVDAKDIHYKSLNDAIQNVTGNSNFCISREDHLTTFDGLKTTEKLDILSARRGLPSELHKEIWDEKQKLTFSAVLDLVEDHRLVNLFRAFREEGYKLAVCSNSIRTSVYAMLSKIGVMPFVDIVISNEDVFVSKPHPEMYWKAMSEFGVLPEETLIIEDSPVGLLAASRTGAHILRVSGPSEVTIKNIRNKLDNKNIYKKPKWQGGKMNVLIPMAGAGSRFEQAGYSFPKPLIEVKNLQKPMIQVITENLNIDARFIYVVQKSHREKYNLDTLLNLISPGCKIVEVDGVTEGAACTTLLAKNFIDNDEPLLMANSDQFVEWNSSEFMYKMVEQDLDGGIVTFTATHPKWSFARVNEDGYVEEVAEKNPISDIATVGIYYWKHGSDYVKYAEQMIKKNIRVNNEFYVAPVFNEAIADGKRVKTFGIERMWGIGTPEDLEYFMENYEE
jgi:HAD superfamily hydrolase (TIGR01509 family)